MQQARIHLLISGKVQGVWYRASTVEQAAHLGLKGWVRNRQDGTVEAVAEGPEDACQALVRWCRQGPERAEVHGVDVTWDMPKGSLLGFEKRPTL